MPSQFVTKTIAIMKLTFNELQETIYALRDTELKCKENAGLHDDEQFKRFWADKARTCRFIEQGLSELLAEMHETGLTHASVEIVRE